ncbi:LysM peptidoglycan-binding domain-containing protein [Ureibacillus sp. Re31]|uniref:LysM peptidoglycan-binding domain-containing protein n=1 Tax=Ureibacillus galli TaxID=2762222 RepID=A0ABR8XA36_9BACL|nr:3D domain-containing protein [Ureibacillus galli]MBD8026169.1 LysM peptidoglycan-binding domain-containing protein [Ureibacillus galli]
MKSKIVLLSLLLVFSITTNSFAMDIDKSAMHTNDAGEQIIITDSFENQLFDHVLEKDKVFYKSAQPETYEVKDGDNLFRIALNHQVELEDLMEWNNLNDYTIHPGDELVLYEDHSKQEKKTTVADASSANTQVKQEKSVKEKKNQSNSKTTETKSAVSSSPEPTSGKEMTVTATAYTAYCEGCSGTTAIGINLRANPNQKVIAVDPNIIPLGSRVWVEGYGEAIAGDTGGAIKGNKIDVFIPSQDQALEWGRKKVKVKILN